MRRTVTIVTFMSLSSLASVVPGKAQDEYDDLPTMNFEIQRLARLGGDNASWARLPQLDNEATRTAGGNVILYLFIGKGTSARPRANILVTGTLHAREWVAYRCVLDVARFIVFRLRSSSWPADSRFDHFRKFKEMNISDLSDNAVFYFVPIVNPDGYDYSFNNDGINSAGGWRKSRRDTAADPPGNGINWGDNVTPGVDLNRSFPVTSALDPTSEWGYVGLRGGVQVRTSRRRTDEVYCGRPQGGSWGPPPGGGHSPILEKETEGIVTLSRDVAFSAHIDIHSYSGIVGWVETPFANDRLRFNGGFNDREVFQILAAKAADMIQDPNGSKYEPQDSPYPTSGEILAFQYEKTAGKCLSMLIEVGKRAVFNPDSATAHSNAVLPGQLFIMFAAVDKSFSSNPIPSFRKPGSALKPPSVPD